MEKKKLYLNGEWVDTGDYFDVVDPGNHEILAQVSIAGPKLARKAVDDAWEALLPNFATPVNPPLPQTASMSSAPSMMSS
jgi:acyl-CoA reductase-like NAD-dependent aldehyde dehydrogenase